MRDINDLVAGDYADHVFTANDINNLGQITGFSLKAGTEDAVPIWALPLDKHGHGEQRLHSPCTPPCLTRGRNSRSQTSTVIGETNL